jgi:hypothetical protein
MNSGANDSWRCSSSWGSPGMSPPTRQCIEHKTTNQLEQINTTCCSHSEIDSPGDPSDQPFARLVYLQGQSMMFHKLNNSLKSEPLHISSLIYPSYHLLLHYMNEWPTTLLGIRWFLSLRRNSHDAPLSHLRVRQPPPGYCYPDYICYPSTVPPYPVYHVFQTLKRVVFNTFSF